MEFDLLDFCTLKRYTADEAKQCLASKHVMFLGDSLTRYQFFSFVHFLDKGQYPPRFPKSTNCLHVDENGRPQCAPPDQPNLCMEGDWRSPGKESWKYLFSEIGGSDDGGLFEGRMECSCARSQGVENQMYATPPSPLLGLNGGSQTIVSSFQETGWASSVNDIKGYTFTGCALQGTCRLPYAVVAQRDNNSTLDFSQPLVDALHPSTGVIGTMTPRPDVVLYNRGLWGKLEKSKAEQVFPLLYNMTGRENGRCFYRTTTAEPGNAKQMHQYEINDIFPAVYANGCSLL